MISRWVSELSFRFVGFFSLRVRSEVRVGDYGNETGVSMDSRRRVKGDSPESMAAILRISFEHLNSGETMSIFAS